MLAEKRPEQSEKRLWLNASVIGKRDSHSWGLLAECIPFPLASTPALRFEIPSCQQAVGQRGIAS